MVKISRILQILTYLVVLISYAAVFQYMEPYYSAGFGALLALSVYLNFNRFIRIPRWVLNSVSILVLIVSALTINKEYLVEPVLGALIVLVAIKLLEEKTFRDYAQIFAMCIFLLIGSSLLSMSIAFLGYFTLIALFSTTALILLSFFSQDADISIYRSTMSKILLQSFLICAIALPGSLIFFTILPRTNYPIFSFLSRHAHSRAGFSDSIRLGEISEIQQDNNVIFRAEMTRVDDKDLFWRGIVLDQFDGVSWKNSGRTAKFERSSLQGSRVPQVIYLEPYGNKYLFALDKPLSVALRRVQYSGNLTYSRSNHIHERIKYETSSVISNFLPEKTLDRERYLHLPDSFSPKIEKLVAELTQGETGVQAVKAIVRFFGEGSYRYSMKNLPTSPNPLEDFLFRAKQGNCEFFASSLAVMLRMAGVPARLVGGYRGGYYNNAAGYYMVLQHNAHVWVEAYLPERQGWLRIDPTTFSQLDPSLNQGSTGFLVQFRLLLDTFNYYWYRLIISYDFSRQLALIKRIKATIQKPDIKIALAKKRIRQYLPHVLAIPLVAFLVYLAASAIGKPPEKKLVVRFQRKLRHHGYNRKSSEGLEEFVARIEDGELREKAGQFVEGFQSIYYRDGVFSAEEERSLKRRIREI